MGTNTVLDVDTMKEDYLRYHEEQSRIKVENLGETFPRRYAKMHEDGSRSTVSQMKKYKLMASVGIPQKNTLSWDTTARQVTLQLEGTSELIIRTLATWLESLPKMVVSFSLSITEPYWPGVGPLERTLVSLLKTSSRPFVWEDLLPHVQCSQALQERP